MEEGENVWVVLPSSCCSLARIAEIGDKIKGFVIEFGEKWEMDNLFLSG